MTTRGEAGSVPPMPLVSVVTPSLDPGDRLRRCLASVAAQDHPSLEHVVVDGGSTDGTRELLTASSARWVSEPDGGQSDALNKGFALARGDILGWLNADDVLLPGAVSAVVAALAADPAAGWAYGDCEIVPAHRASHIRRPGPVAGPESFFDSNPIAQPGVFVTRRALERVGGVDASFALAMDFDLWLRLVDAGFPGVYVPSTLARFEITASSKTGSTDWSLFLREEALALARSGRPREAGIKLGTAAAWASVGRAPAGWRELGGEEASAIAWARSHGFAARSSHVRAGAAMAASTLGGSPRRLLQLLRPALWLERRTRRAVLDRARRRITTAAGRRR